MKKNFFTEIISTISDATFSKNGNFIFSRDFLTMKIWDLRKTDKVLDLIQIFEPLKSKLCDLYENECIFDKFNVVSSPCSNFMATGYFDGKFHLINYLEKINMQFHLDFNKETKIKQISKKYTENLGPHYEFRRKTLKCSYHPNKNLISVACLNSLYFYGI